MSLRAHVFGRTGMYWIHSINRALGLLALAAILAMLLVACSDEEDPTAPVAAGQSAATPTVETMMEEATATPVQTPEATPTPAPTPTATPRHTATPTPTPTATPTPTPTATPTPTPTATPTPNTPTPTPTATPTPTPTATPTSAATDRAALIALYNAHCHPDPDAHCHDLQQIGPPLSRSTTPPTAPTGIRTPIGSAACR